MKRIFPAGLTCVTAIVALSLLSCASTGKKVSASVGAGAPKWIELPGAVYAYTDYIAQVGNASDKDSAELAAVQKIAALFGQDITSAGSASKRMEQAQKDGEVATVVSSSDLNQKIQQTVRQDNLIGIKIAETWLDSGRNTWYALAVLNRAEAAQIYTTMIDKNNATIKKLCATLKPVTIYTYANISFAKDIAEQNKRYINHLFVIMPETGRQKAAESITPEELSLQAHKLATEIPVYVQIENDRNKRIATAFEKTLSELGFNSTAGRNAPYTLTGSLYLAETTSAKKDVYYSEYLVQCNVRDISSQQNVCTWSLSGRDGSKTPENAENRALTSAARKIEEQFEVALLQSIKNLPQ